MQFKSQVTRRWYRTAFAYLLVDGFISAGCAFFLFDKPDRSQGWILLIALQIGGLAYGLRGAFAMLCYGVLNNEDADVAKLTEKLKAAGFRNSSEFYDSPISYFTLVMNDKSQNPDLRVEAASMVGLLTYPNTSGHWVEAIAVSYRMEKALRAL